MSTHKGLISTGSKEATEAAADVLKLGGNAFDAAISAVMTSMTSEVNLTSMAGGGSMLAYKNGEEPILFDFFVDAPYLGNKTNFEFYKTDINFGDTIQSFHIGKGSIAVPGNVKGLLHVHRKLGKLPFKVISEPAIDIAKNGVKLSKSQSYITSLLEGILQTSDASKKLFFRDNKLISEGDIFKNEDLAEFIQWISEEGDRPFYEGEIGRKMIEYLGDDGIVSQKDLLSYKVVEREPLKQIINNKIFYTNPSPSVGGTLIIFLLKLLYKVSDTYSFNHELLVYLMAATTNARFEYFRDPNNEYQLNQILSEETINTYSEAINKNILNNIDRFKDNRFGATTHVSILDKDGNAASITTTNGESCGHVLPGTGIILNNMLGEEDLNPLGFHNWKKSKRLSTLISPSVVINKEGHVDLVLGSAGSNRIRSAIVQVILNYLINNMSLENAVFSPRLHLEDHELHFEPGINFSSEILNNDNININAFSDINLFFGGVNAVSNKEAVADPRRGGCGDVI